MLQLVPAILTGHTSVNSTNPARPDELRKRRAPCRHPE